MRDQDRIHQPFAEFRPHRLFLSHISPTYMDVQYLLLHVERLILVDVNQETRPVVFFLFQVPGLI